MIKKLSEFTIGEKGIVKKIECDSEIKRRMIDMGLVVGVEIELKRIAPLGDPVQVSIRGYDLAIRKKECRSILVEVE